MKRLYTTLAPVFLLLIAFTFVEAGITTDYADARSRGGGRSFKMNKSYSKSTPKTNQSTAAQKKSGSGMSRGLMGGLLGGALGGLLFGSLMGAGGSGMGILPILLLAGGAFFLYRKFASAKQGQGAYPSPGRPAAGGMPNNMFGGGGMNSAPEAEEPEIQIGGNLLEEGFDQIRETDKGFDVNYFKEIASDVFFQIQAGWMRRDLDSYKHLLGTDLAAEYDKHFQEMREKGQINKLESIAIRTVEVTQAGSESGEDFISVLFKANLLDYTVDEKSGDLIDGSMTTPVKFEEEWTWARPTGTQDWKLEGLKEV